MDLDTYFTVSAAQHRNSMQSDILELCTHKKQCLGANALISDHFSFEENLRKSKRRTYNLLLLSFSN